MRACLSGATYACVKDTAWGARGMNQSLMCSECGFSPYANKPPTIYSKYKIYTSQKSFPKVFRVQVSCCRESYPENSARKTRRLHAASPSPPSAYRVELGRAAVHDLPILLPPKISPRVFHRFLQRRYRRCPRRAHPDRICSPSFTTSGSKTSSWIV